ncbi:MAG: HAD family hydrolase [Alphaproteobacteria bacterium]|nr:MAG: HAD family hydrolase [Alphaproteobacteria bacterium]
MSRPLLISDCDDVLLHFAPHFAEWVAEAHGLTFSLDVPAFGGALKDAKGRRVPAEQVWPLLSIFFDREMHRQQLVAGALDALRAISAEADIVILTNIGDQYHANRVAQLERFDIRHRVLCNQGGKGRPVLELVEKMRPSATVFVDDLAPHHESVAKHAPDVWRLHMIAEARIAAATPPAPHAHARIDDWESALPWIRARLNGESE